ncbi:uncharacterized protein BROUX77_001761 [Berkeleyomyces rouxiae]|uniref:uncharacterized protein n=1 Tax=Berkeleyomyces rouxiae TaxID=2035830 RepID=UPI003B7C10BB
MEYPSATISRRHVSQRRSPVINSSITKRQSSHNTSPHAKRWSMYDGNVFAAAANAINNYSLDASMPRARPTSMFMAMPASSSSASASYLAAITAAPMASPLSEPMSDMVFSPSLAMTSQHQQGYYSPASYTYMAAPQYTRGYEMSRQQQQQQQQQIHCPNYSDYPPTLPDSVPSSFDMSALSMPGFEASSVGTKSPQFTAPMTPEHLASSSSTANSVFSTAAPATTTADEDSGEVLHGMGLYDDDAMTKDDADLALDSSRDCMQSLLADTTRAAQPTKMLLMKDFEPEASDDEDEFEQPAAEDAEEEGEPAEPVVQEQPQEYFQPVYNQRMYPVQSIYNASAGTSWI